MKKTTKLISILLVMAMLLSMAPLSLTANAAAEAISLRLNISTKVDYSDSATQYYQYDNYLYKVAYSNLKNITEVAIYYNAYDYLFFRYTKSDTGKGALCNLLTSYGGSIAKLSNLPTAPGSSVAFYANSYEAIFMNENNPVVSVTCMAVNEPVWSWSGSSATAAFTSTDGKATMTVDATIESSEQTAATCLEIDKTTYTATATANGKTYTNEKTVDGEQGPHSFEYSGDDVIGNCTNGCGYECPHKNQTGESCEICGASLHTHSFTYSASGTRIIATCLAMDTCPLENGIGGMLTISAPADLYADGTTVKEATVENNLVDTSVAVGDITYSTADGSAPKTAGTYTASVTIGGATASVEFTLLNYAAKVTDKDGNELEGSPYKTFADAVTAAENCENSTLTLIDNVTLTEEQYLKSGKFTLDLNGKTLLHKSIYLFEIKSDADITIKDSGENGTIETKEDGYAAIYNYGILTVESGTIKGSLGISNLGTLNFKNGEVEADNYSAISNSGTAYIHNGKFKSANGAAISNHSDSTTLHIYGGEFNGNSGFENHGTAYIEGGEFTGNSYAALNLLGGTVEITGGSFTGKDDENGYYAGTPKGEWTVCLYEGATLILKGGEFPNGFVTDNSTANAFPADGYYYKDADGKLIEVAGNAKKIDGYVKVTKGADLSEAIITLDKTEFTYNGSEIKPAVTVTVGGKTLTENTDYTVSYANNINAGTATAIITAVSDGDYSGEATAQFIINKKPVTVTATAPDKVYDGTTDILEYSKVIVKFDGAVEGEMLGFTVEKAWYDSTDAGTDKVVHIIYAPVASNSIDNYEFPMNSEYSTDNYYVAAKADINAKDISDASIILGDTLTYNGTEQTQTVTAVEIPADLDVTYTVSGNKATNVGVYLLTVTGTGNFTGEAKIAYEIAVDMNGVDFDQLHWGNVKSTDKERIEYIYNQIDNAVTDLASDEKKAEWNNLRSTCVELLKMIESITSHLESYKEEVAGYDIDTVTSDDYDYLERLSESEGQWLYDHSENYTEEEIIEFSQVNAALTKLLIRISDVAKEITRITNAVNGYDKATVKSSDKADLEQLIADINALTTGKNITDTERADLLALADTVNELLAVISDTADEISRIVSEVNAYDIDTVTGDDVQDLLGLIDDVNVLLETDNLTSEETEVLNQAVKDVQRLISIYDTVSAQLGDIKERINRYDEATVKSSDKADIEQLIADIKDLTDGQNITAEEREYLVNADAECDKFLAKIAETTAEYDRVIAAANGYDEATVTSADKEALVQLNEDIYALALTDNVTAEEKENLQAAHDKVLGLIDKLTGISDEIKRIIEAVDKYVFESVKSSDKADIQQLIADIKALLDTQNITADERALLEGADETCTKLIEKIDETVAEISRINDATNAYDIDTVTSADKADIEKLLADIKALTDGDNITDAEREQLNGNETTLNAFLDKIGATADEIERIENAVNSYDEATVKSTDKADLEKLIEDIKALTDGKNITDDERAKLAELDKKIEALIKKIDDTAAEIARIDEAVNAYDEETVKSSDVPALGKLIEDIKALTDGDNLTEDEKAALKEADKAIDELVEKLTEVAEEIKKVDEAVKSYDEETVKSSDSDELAQLKEDIQSLIDSGNVTENEKTVLEDMITYIESLEDKIVETEEKLEEIKGIENNYNPENITSDDKTAIEEAIVEIEAVNPDNLTDEQKAEYEEIKAGFEALLEEIEAAGAEVDAIGAELEKFDEERVTKFWEDDIEALKAKIDELLADENMGEAEKAKLNEYKAQADNLIEIINDPCEYFSCRLFYFIWDCLTWKYNGILYLFKLIFAC